MDYEKAYKAVLQTATQWIKDGCTDKEKICLECVFPELRESEDERIRKKCIVLIKRVIPSGDNQSQESKEILDCIAYLEKQKEQKPAWSEEDEAILDSVIRIITQFDDLAHEPTFAGPKWTHPYTKELAWLKSLRPSWKPSDEQMEALEKAIVRSCSHQYGVPLSELYEQLKKL